LDVPQRNSGVEGRRDECVSQSVRPNALGDACLAGDATHDPSGGVTVEPLIGHVDEDRAFETFADREVKGPGDPRRQRHRDDAPAFAGHR